MEAHISVPRAKDGLCVDLFSTAPQSADSKEGAHYLEKVAEVSRWSEQAGCKGMLIYTDNRLVDPWLVAQVAIQSTNTFCPLVATQPIYMHPYAVANIVSSLAYFYNRRIYLNMVAGGFRNDLLALGDDAEHDVRYERLVEYTTIIKQLLNGSSPVTFSGKFYRVENLRLKPPLPSDLFPGIFLSGSSEAGKKAAAALEATAVEYPNPAEEYEVAGPSVRVNSGMRIGIIAHEDDAKAWEIAHERFPGDRKGQITHQLAMKMSDSSWHKQLSKLDEETEGQDSPYWLWPFKNYKTFCPYLVGSYEGVSAELAKYIKAGFDNFILDVPVEEWDLRSAGTAFRRAAAKAGVQEVEKAN